MKTPADNVELFRKAAEKLVLDAEANGVIITITREPLQPLAMGNHTPVVSAYENRRFHQKEKS